MSLNLKGQRIKGKSGQALVELAVFGAFFLLILSSLITYGLRYNFQQRNQMISFRRAMAIASSLDSDNTIRGSGGYSLSQMYHVPDASDEFGVGTTTAVSSSAAVTRDYMLTAQPTDASQLSSGPSDVQTSRVVGIPPAQYRRRAYKTAAFRREYGVAEENVVKYNAVYGSGVIDEGGGTLKIIDPCSGEVPDYATCYMQARMLVDVNYCAYKCNLEKIPGSSQDCNSDCGKVTNPPNQNDAGYNSAIGGAWYAADYSPSPCGTGGPPCYFPHLDELFNFGALENSKKSMGLQKDMISQSLRDETISKNETPADITTHEATTWSDTYNQKYILHDNVDGAGFENVYLTPGQYTNVTTEIVPAVVSGSSDQTWSTAK